MKKIVKAATGVLLVLVMNYFPSAGQTGKWIQIKNDSRIEPEVHIVSSDRQAVTVEFNIQAYAMPQVIAGKGSAFIAETPGGSPLQIKGAPDLQAISRSVIIPDTDEMDVQVISSHYTELKNVDIAPSKGVLARDIDPATIPYVYGKAYQTDRFFPGKLAELDSPFILRDFRGQTIRIYPFQYNPVSKVLRIYSEITVQVSSTGNIGKNTLSRSEKEISCPVEFQSIYNRHFINFQDARYTPINDKPGNMLIISYGDFMDEMQPFIAWKKLKGIQTEIVDVSTIGGTSEIKSYVANYYNTNGLTYLLLVGDHAQVPSSSTSSGDSDNNYGYIAGSDHYLDIFVGRFSAETANQVTTQVNRTVSYEKTPQAGADWYHKGIGIASDQGPGDDNEYDNQHMDTIRRKLMDYNYTLVNQIYDPSGTAADVTTALNEGRGIINYVGHGSQNSWGSSGFSITDVDNLTNDNKLPFIISVACVNGDFTEATCFAESWLRATNGSNPAGAIAMIASTINQSWDSPMCGQDEMIDILTEKYPNNIKHSFGGIAVNGIFQMIEEYAADGEAMADTWTIFGDPSVMVFTNTPAAMTVTHNATIPVGSTQLVVSCNVEDALISLTIDGEIIGKGYIHAGSAVITFSQLTMPDTIQVTATAYNHLPYFGETAIIAPNGPFVIFDSYIIHDLSGNNNSQADFGEDITLNLTLKNVGSGNASNVSATISTSNSNVTITDQSESFGNIAVNDKSTGTDAYAMTIHDHINDQEKIAFDMDITDGTEHWPSKFFITCQAPSLKIKYIDLDDNTGNNNKRLDPGETAELNIHALNSGHAASPNATIALTSTSGYVTINTGTANPGVIGAGSSVPESFNITTLSTTPIGTQIDFTFTLTAGEYTSVLTVKLDVGLIVEDWEKGHMKTFPWTTGGDVPWTVITSNPYEGTYCAVSGDISDGQKSTLSMSMDVLIDDSISFYKKVSCEDSDLDDWDFLCFRIDSTEKGRWDGELDWSRSAFEISKGIRTINWSYEKDDIESEGSDCAWLDFIVFPPFNFLAVHDPVVPEVIGFSVYPNPANAYSVVSCSIPFPSQATLSLFNLNGEVVTVFFSNMNMKAGTHEVYLNTQSIPQGFYFCRLILGDQVFTEKLVITR